LDDAAKPPFADAKYALQSLRGGRGGKVTSVAAMWTSLAEGSSGEHQGNKPISLHTAGISVRAKEANVVKNRIPKAQNPSPTKKILNCNYLVANLADRSASNRPEIVKSTTVPAVISSSMAMPVLSSTASLARPVSFATRKYYPPSLPNTVDESASTTGGPSYSENTDIAQDNRAARNGGVTAFGQTRLKDLIRKYQEGPK